MERSKLLIRPSFLLSVLLLLTSSFSASISSGEEKTKQLSGKSVFETKCLQCHKPSKFKDQHHDRRAWEQILSRMELNTCVLSDAEASAVADYLVKEFGE